MTEQIAAHLDAIAQYAPVWGFLLIFIFMTIESSFIPFPSEVVMIPAGFLAFKGQLTTGNPWIDCIIAVVVGCLGSIAGAYINYYLALKLGRTFLHKYGKYFFLKEPTLDRAEEIFRKYGELATFVCRLPLFFLSFRRLLPSAPRDPPADFNPRRTRPHAAQKFHCLHHPRRGNLDHHPHRNRRIFRTSHGGHDLS